MNSFDQRGIAFGRRGRDIGVMAARADALAKPVPAIGHLACLFGLAGLLLVTAFAIYWTLQGTGRPNAEIARAEQRVIEIVNQPVTHLPRSGAVVMYSPGWFHPGAITPDFNNVDVRATQQLLYDAHDHVTSDLNPGEMFIGDELEFNAMTKYFYTDRTLPKKRLSEAEMIEINGLYRVIGRNEQSLFVRWLMIAGLAVVGAGLGAMLFMLGRQSSLNPADGAD